MEYLRNRGDTPYYSWWEKDNSLADWYSYHLENFESGKMQDPQRKEFARIAKGGDIYDFYVTNRKESFAKLRRFDKYIHDYDYDDEEDNGEIVNKNPIDFNEACDFYKDFCFRMERHPQKSKDEEKGLAKWFEITRRSFFDGLLTDKDAQSFNETLQSVAAYPNNNKSEEEPPIPEEEKAEQAFAEGPVRDIEESDTKSHASHDSRWLEMYNAYISYIEEHHYIPTQSKDGKLYHWIYRQKNLLEKGDLPETRRAKIQKLLDKVAEIKETRRPEQGKAAKEKVMVSPKVSGSKHVKQDELWNSKWQAYMDYMTRNKRRPSKHHAEDMVLFDWFKHSKKLLNQGKMRADRVEKFKLLLGEAKDFQRINQHNYVNPKIKTESPNIRLRDYQADMKKRIEDAFLQYDSVMVQMPTGTGKTHVIASVVQDFVKDGMGWVWVVAHRRELVSQLKQTLGLFLQRVRCSTSGQRPSNG